MTLRAGAYEVACPNEGFKFDAGTFNEAHGDDRQYVWFTVRTGCVLKTFKSRPSIRTLAGPIGIRCATRRSKFGPEESRRLPVGSKCRRATPFAASKPRASHGRPLWKRK